MALCGLCAGNPQKLLQTNGASGQPNPTDMPLNIDQMLGIFRGLPTPAINQSMHYTCETCLEELKFCYKFYSKLMHASRVLSTPSFKIECRSFRKIAPKPSDGFSATHNSTVQIVRKRRYRCEECFLEFTSYRQLRCHHKTHEVENVCKYCGIFFFENETMHVHLQEKHANMRYECPKCEKRYPSRNLLFKHLRIYHQAVDLKYRCNECKKAPITFHGKSSIEDHIKTAHPDYCKQLVAANEDGENEDIEPDMIEEFLDDMDEEFLDEFLLNQDQSSFCWDDLSLTHFDDDLQSFASGVEVKQSGRYMCPQCNEPFQAQQSLIQHLAHTHDEFVLICNTCGLSFNRNSKLKQHSASHSLKDSLRSSHKDSTQPLASTLECSVCDRKYKTLAGLKYHLLVHSAAKPFTCPYCQRTFTANTNLNAHIRNIHAKIKPHLCTLCDRKFASLDHLKKHVMSVHQKERNHLCSVCGKSFSQASHLTQHALIHSGKKPFPCEECSAGFFKSCDLRRHVEKIHKCAEKETFSSLGTTIDI